jgi:hypothetical protein
LSLRARVVDESGRLLRRGAESLGKTPLWPANSIDRT